MHYYSFHIGDYAAHTRHLSLIEDLAYRRLLDLYYMNEKPIVADTAARLIGMREHGHDVLCVLIEFFEETEEGYINKRADQEIASFKAMSEGGKRGANKRWHNKANGEAIATLSPSDSIPNQPPIATVNHEPLTNISTSLRSVDRRASRLTDDWFPSDDDVSFCETERPDLKPGEVACRFRDYWIAQPGAKGRKVDWSATWRNWVRNEKKINGKQHPSYQSAKSEADAAYMRSIGLAPQAERLIQGEVL